MQIDKFSIKIDYYPYTERAVADLKYEKSYFNMYHDFPRDWLKINIYK